VDEDLSVGSIADLLLAAATLAAPRPVALDIVLDFVIPRALGEVGVLDSALLEDVLELLVELDIVLDFVIPLALGEVGVLDSALLEDVLELLVEPPVLGRPGVPDILASLLALMVAESTVFCRLKLEV